MIVLGKPLKSTTPVKKTGNIVLGEPIAPEGGLRQALRKDVLDRQAKMEDQTRRMKFGYDDIGVGAKQLAGHTVAGVNKAFGGDGIDAVDEYDQYVKDREANYQGPADDGFDFARMGGNMVNPVSMMGPGKFGQAMSMVPKFLTRAGLHTANNIGQSMVMPVTSDDYSSVQGKRAAIGAGLGAGLSTLSKAGKKGYNYFTETAEKGAEDYLRRGLQRSGVDAQDAVNRLRQGDSLIPGHNPTISNIGTQSGGKNALFGNLERTGRASPESANTFANIDEKNMEAVTDFLKKRVRGGERPINPNTGDPQKSLFEQARARETGPMFDASEADMVYIPDLTAKILRGPETSSSANKALSTTTQEDLHRVAGITGKPELPSSTPNRPIDELIPVEKMPGEELNPLIPNYQPKQIATALRQDPIGRLQAQSKELDSVINKAQIDGDNNKVRLLGKAKRELDTRMRGGSPGYDEAMNKFADMSIPQNRADMYSEILRKYDNLGQSNEAGVLNLLNEPEQFGKQTKIPFDTPSIEKIVRPNKSGGQQTMADLETLRKTVQGDLDAKRIYAPGSVREEIKSDIEQIADRSPGLLNRTIVALKSAADTYGGFTSARVKKLLNETSPDREALAKLIEGDGLPEPLRNKLQNILKLSATEVTQNTAVREAATRITEE